MKSTAREKPNYQQQKATTFTATNENKLNILWLG